MIEVEIGKKKIGIRGEKTQWEVCEYRKSINKTTGKPVGWVPVSFYPSVVGLINGLFEMKLRASDATSLTELQQAVKKAKDELKGLYDLEAA